MNTEDVGDIKIFAQGFQSGQRQKQFAFSTHEWVNKPKKIKNYAASSLRLQYNNVYYPRSQKEGEPKVASEKDSTVLQNISGIVTPFQYRQDQDVKFEHYTADKHAQELRAFYEKALVERYTKEAEDVKLRAMWATIATTGVLIVGCVVAFSVVSVGGTAILIKIPTIISTYQNVSQSIQDIAVRKIPVHKALGLLAGKTALAYFLGQVLPEESIFSGFGGFSPSHSWWENTSHVLKACGLSAITFSKQWAPQVGGNLALGKLHDMLLSKTQLAQAVANETAHNMLYKNISFWRSVVYRKVYFQNPQLGHEMSLEEMIEFGHKLAGNHYDVRYILSMDEKKNLSFSRQFFLQTQRIIGISSITSFLFHTIRSAYEVLEKETSLKLQYNSSTMIDYNIADFIKHRLIAVLGMGAYKLFRPLVQKVITEGAILTNFMAMHHLGKGFSKVVPEYIWKMFPTKDEQTILKRQFYKILPQQTMWKQIYQFVWWAMKDFSTNLARTYLNTAMETATVTAEHKVWETLKEWGKSSDSNLLYYIHNIATWDHLETYLNHQMKAVVEHMENMKREAKLYEKLQSGGLERIELSFYDQSVNKDLLREGQSKMFDNPFVRDNVLRHIQNEIESELKSEKEYESVGGIQQFMKGFDKLKELEDKIQELERDMKRLNQEAEMARESWLTKSKDLRNATQSPQALRDYVEKYTHFAERHQLDEQLGKMEFAEQMSWFYERLKFSSLVNGKDLDEADKQEFDHYRRKKIEMKDIMLDTYKKAHHIVVDREKNTYERRIALHKTAQEELQKLREIHGFQFRYLFNNAINNAFFLRQSEGAQVPMVGTFQTQDASYDTTTIPRQQEFLNQFYIFVKDKCDGDLCYIPQDDIAENLSDLLESKHRRHIPNQSNAAKYHKEKNLQEQEAFRAASKYFGDLKDDRTGKDSGKVMKTAIYSDGKTGVNRIKVNLLPTRPTTDPKDFEVRQLTQMNARRAVLAAIDGGHVKNESLIDKLVFRILYEPKLLELFGAINGNDVMLPIFEVDDNGKLSQNTIDGVGQLHSLVSRKLNDMNMRDELATKFGNLQADLQTTSWWGQVDSENSVFKLKDSSYEFMHIEDIFSDMVDSQQQHEQEKRDGARHKIPPSDVSRDFKDLDKTDHEQVAKFVHKYNHGIRSYLRSNMVENKDQLVQVFLKSSQDLNDEEVAKLYTLAENFNKQYSIVRTNLILKNPAGIGIILSKYLDGTLRGEVKSSTQMGYEMMYRYPELFRNNDNQYFTQDFDGSSQAASNQADRLILNNLTNNNEELTETVLHSKTMTNASHQAATRLSLSELTATVMNSVDGPEGVLNMEEKDVLNTQGSGTYSYFAMVAASIGDPTTKDTMLEHINKRQGGQARVSANSNIDLTSFVWMAADALADQVPENSRNAPFETIRNLIGVNYQLETGQFVYPTTKEEFSKFLSSIEVDPTQFQSSEEKLERDKEGNVINLEQKITVDPRVYRYLTVGSPDGMVAYFHDRHVKKTLSTSWLRYAVGMNEGVIAREDAEYYKNLPEYQALKEEFPDLPDAHVMMRNAVLQGTDYERFTKIPESGKMWVEYNFADRNLHKKTLKTEELSNKMKSLREAFDMGKVDLTVPIKRFGAGASGFISTGLGVYALKSAWGSVSIVGLISGSTFAALPLSLGASAGLFLFSADALVYSTTGKSYIVYPLLQPADAGIHWTPDAVLNFFGYEKKDLVSDDEDISQEKQ